MSKKIHITESQLKEIFKKIKEETNEELELEKLDDDVLTNLTEDISKELDEIITKKEKYLDFLYIFLYFLKLLFLF